MKPTADLLIVPAVVATIGIGAALLHRSVSVRLREPGIEASAQEPDVYHVSWFMFVICLSVIAFSTSPIAILVLAPNPGWGGYVFFGGIAAMFALLGIWGLRLYSCSEVRFGLTGATYTSGKRKQHVPADALKRISIVGWNIVCELDDGTQVHIPLYFSRSSLIAARFREMRKNRANQALQTTSGTRSEI